MFRPASRPHGLSRRQPLRRGPMPACPSPSPTKRQHLAAAAIWAGIFCLWSFEYAVAVPYFQRLGFSTQVSYLLWCAGPVSGLVVGPVVGVSSDRCRSSVGRRRPFIAGGVIATVVAAVLFASAQSVAQACSPSAARVLAVLGFWLMDLSINTIQNPARALMSDISESQEEQVAGQSTIAQFCGLGYVLGFSIVSFWPDALGQLNLYTSSASAFFS